MRIVSLLMAAVLLGHEGNLVNRKPSAADPQIKLARKKLSLLKRGKYVCCKRTSCDLCAMRYGKCECALNLKQHKQVCGQCLPAQRGSGVTLRKPTAAVPPSKETQEVAKLLLEAKRTLVKEKRYACCKRGGCDECTFEADCPCGKDLAAKGEKGVCGSCYDGWHAGEGSFRNIDVAEVKLAEMPGMTMPYVSGTAQIPDQAPMYMTEVRKKDWTFMTMGQLNVVSSQQSGPRGGDKVFAGNWFMPMASRKVGIGTLTLRGMFSLEPATVTQGRYPLLFQEGETYRGQPIRDGQHPHNAFMEIAALYQIPVSDRVSVYFYGGPRGEPALGPVPYPHRLSASENPMAALGHHYQDSTHIANNVVTSGVTVGRVTLEASGFLGREPGEARWSLEKGAIDSVSGRATVKLTGRSMVQYSQGHINQVAERKSLSYTYVRPHAGGYWASSLIYGHNVEPKHTANSFLAESTALLRNKHWLWGRIEYVDRDSFHGKVTATTIGYGRELKSPAKWLSMSLGGQFNFFGVPPEARPLYGSSPVGAQVNLRMRLKSSRMTF
ncbi:MAG: hypothetical protein FJW36_22270 [Acidobacteria bacterium]|nr:hypothetical protein [Acidobacteriota bacterium]